MEYYVLTPLSIFLRIVESFSHLALVSAILGKSIKNRRFFISVFTFVIFYEILTIFLPKELRTIMVTILAITIVYFGLKFPLLHSIISYIITAAIISITDCVISLSIIKISNLTSFEAIINTPHLYFIDSLLIYSITLLIAKLLYIYKSRDKNKIIYTTNITGVVNFITTFVLLVPNLVMILYYYDGKTLPLYIVVINICAIIAMFFVSTYNTRKGFELVTAEQELITQRTYNKTLQNLVDSLRTFKHDYNNTLQTMYGYIQLDNMSELKKFFEQILDESRAITALDKLNPELFNNPSLFGIITAKYEYARQNNVNLNFEMYGKIEDADMQIYDLTRILGIFLDNAIEASTGSEKKKVNFMVTDRKGKIIIEISNTYSEVGLKVEDIDKKGVSSKGENRGLGLYKVKEIIKKYPIVQHETTAINGMFRQKLVINKIRVKV